MNGKPGTEKRAAEKPFLPFLWIVIQENKAAFLGRKQFDAAVQKKPFLRICASTSFH